MNPYNSNEYVVSGAIAGVVLIGVIGLLLALRGRQLRDLASSYVGEREARWVLAFVWFTYVYSALNALGQTLNVLPAFEPDIALPSAVAFLYGSVWHPLLAFLNALVPLVHTAALVVVAFVLFRRPRREPA